MEELQQILKAESGKDWRLEILSSDERRIQGKNQKAN